MAHSYLPSSQQDRPHQAPGAVAEDVATATVNNTNVIISVQINRAIWYQVEGGLQLSAGLEEGDTSEDIQTQPSPGHGHNQTTYVTQVPHILGPHQRQDDVIILLTLVAINSGHLGEGKRNEASSP